MYSEMMKPVRTEATARDYRRLYDGLYAQTPLVRALPKHGRNETCPCGSGRKFKKCCIDKALPAGAAL